MGLKTLLLLSVVAFASANEFDRLTEHRSLVENEQDDLRPQFDIDDLSEIRKAIEDAEINPDKKSYDFLGVLMSLPGVFKNGDAERWTTLNFGYQLACYAGETGSFLSQSLWAISKFNGYGCHCGGGEYYGTYMDATDRCCKSHDECYIRVEKKYNIAVGCHSYTTPYSVSCCKNEKYTKCTDSGPSAGRAFCECDQEMARCVSRNSGSYNKNYLNNRNQCIGSYSMKPLGFWDVLKSCKDTFTPYVTFPQTCGSQGKCPSSGGGGGGFWWGK